MALPIRKNDNYAPQMQIVRSEKEKKVKFTLIIIIAVILAGIIAVPIILNSIDDNPNNVSLPENSINWDNPPCSPNSLGKEWQDITDPRKRQNTQDREFKNTHTDKIIEFHPYNSNGKYVPHWHRRNPHSINRHDYYLDKNGKATPKNSKKSHIYTNC